MTAPLDLSGAITPGIAKTAAGFVGGAGVLSLLVVFQTYANVAYVSTLYTAFLGGLGLVGLGSLVGAFGLSRARPWAATFGPIVAVLSFVASGVWLVASFASGLLSLFALIVPALAITGAVMSLLARKPIVATNDARAKLRGEGLDLGL